MSETAVILTAIRDQVYDTIEAVKAVVPPSVVLTDDAATARVRRGHTTSLVIEIDWLSPDRHEATAYREWEQLRPLATLLRRVESYIAACDK